MDRAIGDELPVVGDGSMQVVSMAIARVQQQLLTLFSAETLVWCDGFSLCG